MGLLGKVLGPVGDAVEDVAELVGVTGAFSTAASTTKHSPAPAPSSGGTTTLSSTILRTTSTSVAPETPPPSSASPFSASAPVAGSSLTVTSPADVEHSSSPIIQLANPSGVATATSDPVADVSSSAINQSLPPPPPAPQSTPPFYSTPTPGDPSGNAGGLGGGQSTRQPPRPRTLTAGQAAAVGIVTAIVILLAIICGYRLYSIRRRRAKRDRMATRPTTWMSQHGPGVGGSEWSVTESSRGSVPAASLACLDRVPNSSRVEPVHRPVYQLNYNSSFETDVVTSRTAASTPSMASMALESEVESNEIGRDAVSSWLTWELALGEPQRAMSHISSHVDFITRITHPEDHADIAVQRADYTSLQYASTNDPFAPPSPGAVVQPLRYGLPAFRDFKFPSQLPS